LTRHAPKEVKDGAMLSALQVDVAGKRHQAVVEVSPAREPFLAIAPFSQDYW
jgi:hypothetical protein